MGSLRWLGFDLIFFDCDSTLSAIEGIDELARLKGKAGRVGLLTSRAMDGELDLGAVYGKRLRAIKPTRAQLKAVEARYWEEAVEDAQAVVGALQALGKQVFIISGGLIDAVSGFGRRLGVDAARIRAVELEYNELSGRWWEYAEPRAQQSQAYLDYGAGPLTISHGKSAIVDELAGELPGRRLLIGDGVSDLAAKGAVDLFVGYGGVIERDKVRAGSDLYLRCRSLAAVLALAGGRRGGERLRGTAHESIYRKGAASLLNEEAALYRGEGLRDQLRHEFEGFDWT